MIVNGVEVEAQEIFDHIKDLETLRDACVVEKANQWATTLSATIDMLNVVANAELQIEAQRYSETCEGMKGN